MKILERRSSMNQNENPRSPKFPLHLVYEERDDFGIKIDRYCPRLNEWTEVRVLGPRITQFAVIHRNGNVILIGGKDEEHRLLNTVNISAFLFSTI